MQQPTRFKKGDRVLVKETVKRAWLIKSGRERAMPISIISMKSMSCESRAVDFIFGGLWSSSR
jgi:hypothetical protein